MTKEERLTAERERLALMYQTEKEIGGDASYIFGIDEAGRGPLCGPVVAACCILPPDVEILYLNDSKKISEKKRELIYKEVIQKAAAYGIGYADPKRIDEINILNATLEAMHEAFHHCLEMYRSKFMDKLHDNTSLSSMDELDGLPAASDSIVLVDGNRKIPAFEFPQITVIGGDAKCPSISAASIIAKVTRDHLLIEYDKAYPEYGFAKHKGYGTKEHVEALKKYGILDIHRRSFLKNILGEQ